MKKYTILQVKPGEAEKKLNALAQQGWKVVSQSESTWTFNKCFGLSHSVDSLLNIVLEKEEF